MAILIFFLAHWYLSLFSQTFFLHRYAAHKMFSMSRAWEKFFYVFTFITQGSSYLSPYAYGILHRMHHAYADEEGDPHSPKHSKTFLGMFIKTWKIFSSIKSGKMEIEPRFLKDIPKWKSFDDVAYHWLPRLIWCAGYVLFYIFCATHWWLYLLLPFHFFMGPLHGVIINWYAHKIGYRNFKLKNTSVNLLPLDFLMMGEAYHNNHHHRPSRPNFGSKWFEIDPAYPFILLMKWAGILKLQTSPVAF
ncbi:MAG: acyl-CoA desaturase [Bacteroidetes bacterium]|nr:acyl-CoA desaturase [Bacteroidota bacterium]